MRLVLFIILISLCTTTRANETAPEETEYVSLFDGTTLDGWKGDEPYWSVRDGAIFGQITEDTQIKKNRFLIYQGTVPGDFELRAEFRVSPLGNSGINYRSEVVEGVEFHALRGYQCDIDGRNRYTGSNYEERRRTTLASIGELVLVPEVEGSGELKYVTRNRWTAGIVQETWPDAQERAKSTTPDQWHNVRIVARGNVLRHYIDDHLISQVVDEDPVNRRLQGRLGIQVHTGPPMTIEYRNLRLRELK